MSMFRVWLRDLSTCPYFRRGGVCLTGCWSEPRCVTQEPLRGWPLARLRARGKEVRHAQRSLPPSA